MSIVPNTVKKENVRFTEDVPEELNLLKKVLSLKIKNFDENYKNEEHFKKENVISKYLQLLSGIKENILDVDKSQGRSMKIAGMFWLTLWIGMMALCWNIGDEKWTAISATTFFMFVVGIAIGAAIESDNNSDLYRRGFKKYENGYFYYVKKLGVKGMDAIWIAFHNIDLKDEKEKLEWLGRECERLGVNGEALMVNGEEITEDVERFIREENLKIYEKKYEDVK